MSLAKQTLAAAVHKALADQIKDADAALRDELLPELLQRYQEEGVKTLDIRLPDGTKVATISLVEDRGSLEVNNEAALVRWVAERYSTEVVQTVRDSFRRQLLTDLAVVDGHVVHKPTGEVVDWATYRRPGLPKSASVRFLKAGGEDVGRHEIARAWQEGQLYGVLPTAPAPALGYHEEAS